MQFSLTKAWNDATAMLSANREVVLIIAGIFFFLPGFLSSFAMGGMQDLSALMDPAAQEEAAALAAKYWWVLLISVGGQMVGTFSLLALLRSADKPTVGEAIVGSLRCIGSALLIYVMLVAAGSVVAAVVIGASAAVNSYAFASVMGIIALIAVVYLSVRISLVAPVLAIEKKTNPITALRRSFALTKGHSGRLLAFYVLLFVAYVIITIPIILITGGVGLVLGDNAGLLIAGLISAAVGTIATAILIAVQAAIHRQLSNDKPGTNTGFQFD